jgi:hypothetical protein
MIKYAFLININYVVSLFILKFEGKVPDNVSLIDLPEFKEIVDTAFKAIY